MYWSGFESSVNSEYSKTQTKKYEQEIEFESSVNSEYSKTPIRIPIFANMFESSVNSEYSKTLAALQMQSSRLRVV